MADGRGITGSAEHDLSALISRLTRHLWEHTIVTNDESDLRAPGTVAHRDAQVAWLPGFHRDPGMEFAVIELHRTLVVDNDPTVVGVAARIVLHEGEATPDMVFQTGTLEGCDFWTIQTAHNL